jgi:hypothetical protein
MPGKKTGFNRFGKKNDVPAQKKRQPQRKRGGNRTNADKVMAQGVGKATRMAFGNSRGRAHCWDAFHPSHLALPRAVGPYTVIRTTAVVTSNKELMIFGTFKESAPNGSLKWSDAVAVSNAGAPGTALGASSGTLVYRSTAPGGSSTSGFTCCPSAFSVQLMNPNALQTTSGMTYAAVSSAQLALGGSTATWTGVAGQVVSFMAPRMMSAGKLALRGVQMDSYPLSMSQVSTFEGMAPVGGGSISWLGDLTTGPDSINPVGWAPIVVSNPEGIELNYLVCVEWRVRFDIANPAVSSHTHHPVASDNTWDAQVRNAMNMGNGVVDIVERVANAGNSLASVGRTFGML